MKIGIFVHSQSGNTARLALAVTHALREKGHDVSVELLRPVGKIRLGAGRVEFRNLPDASGFDVVLMGGPMRFLNASPVLISAVKQMKGLAGKKTLYFLTSFFPNGISGSARAHATMTGLFAGQGSVCLEGCSLAWGLWCGKKRLDAAVRKICGVLLAAA